MNDRYGYDQLEQRLKQLDAVFEALQERDFEKAATLVPKGCKLCGYQEFTETFRHEQYGHGWAGQYEIMEVPPGIYPVYAIEYNFRENNGNGFWENSLRDYLGISLWYKGTVVAESTPGFKEPYGDTAYDSPYCHAVAKNILEGNSCLRLLPPFQAVEVPFEYNGEKKVTYQIIDTGVPPVNKENPVNIKTPLVLPLDEQIQASAHKNDSQTHSPKEYKHHAHIDSKEL